MNGRALMSLAFVSVIAMTPSSICQLPVNELVWPAFVNSLEKLPSRVKVRVLEPSAQQAAICCRSCASRRSQPVRSKLNAKIVSPNLKTSEVIRLWWIYWKFKTAIAAYFVQCAPNPHAAICCASNQPALAERSHACFNQDRKQ